MIFLLKGEVMSVTSSKQADLTQILRLSGLG